MRSERRCDGYGWRGWWRWLALPLVLGACGGLGGSGKPQAVTSFYPLYYLTAQIAGDRAEVKNLVPAGTEPHDWEPSARNVADIKNASIFVYNGAGFESVGPQDPRRGEERQADGDRGDDRAATGVAAPRRGGRR